MKIDGKIVIDTNILVYLLDTNSVFHQFARNIIDNNYQDICIVHKSISEFVSVLSKLGRYDVVENELENIIDSFEILYPTYTSVEVFTELVRQHKPRGNKVYDFEIVSVMLSRNINKIVSINKDDFKMISDIEVISS